MRSNLISDGTQPQKSLFVKRLNLSDPIGDRDEDGLTSQKSFFMKRFSPEFAITNRRAEAQAATKSNTTYRRLVDPDSRISQVFRLSQEVREAVWTKEPVVALESTIYTHGFPYPDNVALALDLEKIVRKNGGIPATIGVLDGVVRVGLNNEEITTLASSAGKPETMKVSRRDVPYILGLVSFMKVLYGLLDLRMCSAS